MLQAHAAADLVLVFIGTIITHLCGDDCSFGVAIVFFLLATDRRTCVTPPL